MNRAHSMETGVRLIGLDELVREAVRAELATLPAQPAGWLDVPAAADYLATTEDAVRAMVKRGEIPVQRTPNGRLLFRADALDAWVTSGLAPDKDRTYSER